MYSGQAWGSCWFGEGKPLLDDSAWQDDQSPRLVGVLGDSRSLAFETESTCPVSCIPLQGLSGGWTSPWLGFVSCCSPQGAPGKEKKESQAEPVSVARPSPRGQEGKCCPEGGLTHGHLLFLS